MKRSVTLRVSAGHGVEGEGLGLERPAFEAGAGCTAKGAPAASSRARRPVRGACSRPFGRAKMPVTCNWEAMGIGAGHGWGGHEKVHRGLPVTLRGSEPEPIATAEPPHLAAGVRAAGRAGWPPTLRQGDRDPSRSAWRERLATRAREALGELDARRRSWLPLRRAEEWSLTRTIRRLPWCGIVYSLPC